MPPPPPHPPPPHTHFWAPSYATDVDLSFCLSIYIHTLIILTGCTHTHTRTRTHTHTEREREREREREGGGEREEKKKKKWFSGRGYPQTPIKHTSDNRKEGNVLFNDALNTFYLRLYGVRHIVEDHWDSERGNPLPPHGPLFPISNKCSFICIIPQTGWHTLLHQSWSTGWNEKPDNRASKIKEGNTSRLPCGIDPPTHRTTADAVPPWQTMHAMHVHVCWANTCIT